MTFSPTNPFYAVYKNSNSFNLFISFLLFLNFTIQAQEPFAKIDKNLNVEAKDLIHELSASKDTLILRSNRKINALYTIHEDSLNELNVRIEKNLFKLPLQGLIKGRHLFVAVQSPNQIVFVVEILEDFVEPDQSNDVTVSYHNADVTKISIPKVF